MSGPTGAEREAVQKRLRGRDLLSLLDLSAEEIREILALGVEVKSEPARYRGALAGRSLFLYFEKPSLRTRVTFEVAMAELGGSSLYYTAAEGRIGVRESVADVARNLDRWVDAVVLRTFEHGLVEEFARHAQIPVVNGLTDRSHPCQALADFLTLQEKKGDLRGLHLAYVGDGNNVAHSLLEAGARLGVHVTVVSPPGYEPDPAILASCRAAAARSGSRILVGSDLALVEGADAVYTDVWASMGQEEESEKRRAVFAPYRVDSSLMKRAGPRALFMHCLPAHRGEEVTDEVADSPASVIFDQAENRLHVQKAILLLLLGAAL
jgi:ornithine carbamoyltransferase